MLPRLSKAQGSAGKKKAVPANRKPEKSKGSKDARRKTKPKKNHELEEAEDEAIVAGVTSVDEVTEEPESPVVEVVPAIAFSDGLVAPCLKDLVVIPRIGFQEVELLRTFLHYFVITETFIGAISTKSSFMKKRGGVLL